ncbi:E3 ubiquitin-protein ligase RNF13 [Tolypocladium ophioglossoides CBS 100239]|uniref:RING-type E3 ubiquitin transferase n=1 Tax=Tolypocladium ophioglossoides (strain CBS 100239) TaxID=1163406 RepID=A0A0L0N047_TOLOC|nr:E3 ubiquitin-protein ligase RNF13 [Tolypocladium ophioglossoides CBS 100239]
MRPPRIAILVLFIAASIFIVCRALTSAGRAEASPYPTEARNTRSLFGFMYYNTPFSLFPPNAAISLTDDNSTSFAARPAAFGPKLAAAGLSGQLWVGSGFAEDSLDGNGELGCSDLPGWGSGNTRAALKNSFRAGTPRIAAAQANSGHPKRGGQLLDPDNRDAIAKGRPHSKIVDDEDDNTDNHFNDKTHSAISRRDTASASSHADIQSLQEATEIQGKIVLLMRGGCGFLEKVMWAQRRGAVAVIVGDNQKGGPLIQMFAHGDEVDNVTVPSVFTARTTAHLLSSLTQPGSFIEDTLDDNGNPVLKVQQGPKVGQDKRKRTPNPRKTAASPRTAPLTSKAKRAFKDKVDNPASSISGNRGRFSSIFSWGHSSHAVDEESRPPSSGRLDWVLVEDWNDEKDKVLKDSLGKSKQPKSNQDDFVIGVQDWRDPDLVDNSSPGAKKGKAADKGIDQKAASSSKDREDGSGKRAPEANGPKGGSITPGSGEYNPTRVLRKDGKEPSAKTGSTGSGAGGKGHGLMSKLFGNDENGKVPEAEAPATVDDHVAESVAISDHEFEPHEGLWVTITPTSSATPFFDTLLVLVISPLVTLTVVYALLIVRARIRRRRWRAPKSVVDRLPVRTYHTVAASPSLSPRLPSPSSATPTTPLLQHSSSRPRPRSRTTTGVLESETFLVPSSAVPTPQTSTRNGGRAEHEKGAGGFSAEWRKYMGRQVECVVCLEEYVDGVSRVMSLPCGHEFHADCITPWLTTRRRTCPICKGDVVRSLAHGSRNGPRYEPYHDDSDEDLDAEASGSRSAERAPDLEQGILSPERDTYQSSRQEGWLGLLSNSFSARTRQHSESPRPEDRSR